MTLLEHRETTSSPPKPISRCTRRTPSIQNPFANFAAVWTSRWMRADHNVVDACPISSPTTQSKFRAGLMMTSNLMRGRRAGEVLCWCIQMMCTCPISQSCSRSGTLAFGTMMKSSEGMMTMRQPVPPTRS